MNKKVDQDMLNELKEDLRGKTPDEAEKTLTIFCQKTGLTINECRVYYNQLVKEGNIIEK